MKKVSPSEQGGRLAIPDSYAKERLGLDLHPKQVAVLRDLFKPGSPSSRVSALCANEVGKTTHIGAPAICYAIEMLNAQVISTAGVWMQVTDQLVPALKANSLHFPGWRFLESKIMVDGVPRYTGFSTRDEGFAQGFHRTRLKDGTERPLLAIIDEAAAVSDSVINGVEDRCNPNWCLMMGSPLDPVGNFYRSQTDLVKHYTPHHISQMDCLTTDGYWIHPETIKRKIEKWGKDHPFVKSNVFGEFPDQVEGALLSLGEFEACRNTEIPWSTLDRNERHGFLDFAAGRNKNVFAIRVANRVWIAKKWTETNTMAAVGEFLAVFRELQRDYGLQAEECEGDADGLGLPMIHRLREVGFNLGEFHGGGKPQFEEMYGNAISEAWGEGAGKIKRKQIILPDDMDFRAQILSRKTRRNSSGKFLLESKEDMKARGLESPDEADAILGAMMPARIVAPQSLMGGHGQGHATAKDDWSRWEPDVERSNNPFPGSHF